MEANDTYRPAFFEVYAAEHLSSALRPALRFVLELLAVRHPALVRLAARSDEIFTGLLLILETSQLRKESALLAESFYSLRRSSTLSFQADGISETRLSTKQVILSVLLSVLAPHAKAKLDFWYSNATGGAASELFTEDSEPFAGSGFGEPPVSQVSSVSNAHPQARSSGLAALPFELLSRIKRILRRFKLFISNPAFRRLALKWYPRISTVCEGMNLLFNILYLFGHTKHFTLSLAIQRLVLRRASASEVLHSVAQKLSSSLGGNRGFNMSQILSVVFERIMSVFKASFFASVFAFRFLQYYYAAEASIPRESGPMVPAPEPLNPVAGVDEKMASASGLCPLCLRNRSSPTACATSGYVYCYLCILRHVQETERCPVTLAPTRVEDLVRVYDDAGGS